MIGIRVPDTSDLPDRLKRLGFRLRLSHGALLEKWISAEESRDTDQDNDVTAAIKALDERLTKLEHQATANTKTTAGKRQPRHTSDAGKRQPRHTSDMPNHARIFELWNQGMSTRKIAEQMAAEGILAPKGKPYHHSTIHQIIKDASTTK